MPTPSVIESPNGITLTVAWATTPVSTGAAVTIPDPVATTSATAAGVLANSLLNMVIRASWTSSSWPDE
jgi:hypothetical protein